MSSRPLDTEALSTKLRSAAVDAGNKRLLITNFHGTEQEQDLSEPANCLGFGRVRHFRWETSKGWPPNPLPIEPACRALGLTPGQLLRAQVFQNAVCNWRCWYCFVDFKLLGANLKHSAWFTPQELMDLYLREQNPPPMIDLTGGQPDLTPEWIPWMMQELRARGLQNEVYLWSDDNLSNDYFWRYLSAGDRELVATYPMYGRVCCFKGYDAESFSFNTRADPALFDKQFQLMGRLADLGIDLYAYVTLTSPSRTSLPVAMRAFVDRLQEVAEHLPLRTVPLEIRMFTPVRGRLDDTKRLAMQNQQIAIEAWLRELDERFPEAVRLGPIVDIPRPGRERPR